jgi:hypothetical protein
MTFLLVVIGSLFGAVALGFPGFVLGAGLGYGIALLLELRQRLDRLERTMQARRRRIAAEAAALKASPPLPERERYPEEDIIHALQEDDRRDSGAEIEDLLEQVQPPRSSSRGGPS